MTALQISAPNARPLRRASPIRSTPCEVTPAEATRCRVCLGALELLVYLRQAHGPHPFTINPAIVGPDLLFGEATARKARDFLIGEGLLTVCAVSLLPRASTPGRPPKVYLNNSLGVR